MVKKKYCKDTSSESSSVVRPTKKQTLEVTFDSTDSESDSDYEEESEEEYTPELIKQDFISYLEQKYVPNDKFPIKLSKVEEEYFKKLPEAEQTNYTKIMKELTEIAVQEVPAKFRILSLPISPYYKHQVLQKINTNSAGEEGLKMKYWIDTFLEIPFGKVRKLDVQLKDATEYMMKSRKLMDDNIYGMVSAKTHMMQLLAGFIANPNSVGNSIALIGPPGVGKTDFAQTVIAGCFDRPFKFFSLGGAKNISNFEGHDFTYTGAKCGSIINALIQTQCMNPVMYFDELDKISETPDGDEIVNLLIHLTDKSQNHNFHDRYFSGIDFDLSGCLFVFSLNNLSKVNPILRDRISMITCGGYDDKDKKEILTKHIWKRILKQFNFTEDEVTLSDSAISFLIEKSGDEKGVRTLMRTVETMITRLNMLRVIQDDSMKQYKFWVSVKFPLIVTEEIAKKILYEPVVPESESWRAMYT